MDSLVERWKNALNSVNDTAPINDNPIQPHNSHKKITESEHILKKSRDEKSKLSLHSHSRSHEKNKSKRNNNFTPSKSKNKNNIKSTTLDKAYEQIIYYMHSIEADLSVCIVDKKFEVYFKNILQAIWNQAKQLSMLVNSKHTQKQQNTQQQYSMQDSGLTSNNSMPTTKKHQKIYQDLQKKYLQCEKQKHFLKNKIDSILAQYTNIDKQLERYQKMQKLIDKCIERQQQTKNQNTRLRRLLQVSQIKLVQQQKIFQKQIINVHKIIDSIKQNLQQI